MAQPSNVRRYRSGVVPKYDQPKEENTFGSFGKVEKKTTKQEAPSTILVDRRLQRLNLADVGDHTERVSRHRQIVQEAEEHAVDVKQEDDVKVKQEAALSMLMDQTTTDEEQIQERRNRILRAREQAQKEKEEKEQQEEAMEEEGSEGSDVEADDEESSELETSDEESSDEFALPSRPLVQPRFVPKDKRASIVEREKMELDEEEREQEKIKQKEDRKNRTLQTLQEEKLREAQNAAMRPEDADVDTDDEEKGVNSKEFEEWQLRELTRIKRDREEREKVRAEKQAIEERRAMTDEQVIAEKQRLGDGVKEKRQLKFLQKYYHKGAFYTEEREELEKRVEHDWGAATGDDAYMEREFLPKVMQVKNFGRSGRTKYTHLKDQDTSKLDDQFIRETVISDRVSRQLGGVGAGFDRPTKKRKLEGET